MNLKRRRKAKKIIDENIGKGPDEQRVFLAMVPQIPWFLQPFRPWLGFYMVLFNREEYYIQLWPLDTFQLQQKFCRVDKGENCDEGSE